MEKIFITVLFGSLITFLYAQNDTIKPKTKISYYHETAVSGMYGLSENYGIGVMSNNEYIPTKNLWGIGIHELHGIQFNPHLILSAEIDFIFSKSYADYDGVYNAFVEHITPCDVISYRFMVGLNLKYIILKRFNWSPYLEINYQNGLLSTTTKGYPSDDLPDYAHSFDREIQYISRTFYASAFAGASYKVNDRQRLYLGLGYMFPGNILLTKIGYQFR